MLSFKLLSDQNCRYDDFVFSVEKCCEFLSCLITIVSVEVNISIYIDRKIDVTGMQFLLVQNRQQTHDWTLIWSGANGLGIQAKNGQVTFAEKQEMNINRI